MNSIDYAKRWIKRPIFSGLEGDRKVLESLIKEIESLKAIFDNPVAYAKINERGDLYDLRLQNNPYNDQTKIVPLYRINYHE